MRILIARIGWFAEEPVMDSKVEAAPCISLRKFFLVRRARIAILANI